MSSLAGLGKTDRERMAAILRAAKGTISVSEAAAVLGIATTDAAKMLARWAKNGWLTRVRRGYYVPVPLESRTADVPLEDPWLVAARLFGPGYIGGWSAAEYLDLTEQIFNTVVVMTTRQPRDRRPTIKGTPFWLRTIPEKALFGLKPVWRGQVKVLISDAARTLVDMLDDPALGGGIRPVGDMLAAYLRSESRELDQLLDYAERLGNGAVFKRLGYLLESLARAETGAMDRCRRNMTTGNAKLDPKLKDDKLVTRWRLWVPEAMADRGGVG